jgi:putative hydrolase of the HAD superfamily
MSYELFLFDADDTLFDFRSAERQAFSMVFQELGIRSEFHSVFSTYRKESEKLWRKLERREVTKDELKIARFRQTFELHQLEVDPEKASQTYLEALSEADILNDHALEICQHLARRGEIGIVTNGIVTVQQRRLAKSAIKPYISFVAVSEACGFAKPDRQFFEYSIQLAKKFAPASTLVIGDRVETDIAGAHEFGLDACLFNPERLPNHSAFRPRYEISHLSELRKIVGEE